MFVTAPTGAMAKTAPLHLTDPHHLQAVGRACTVDRFIDGDTLSLACGPDTVRVRLADVDAPERRGRCPAETALARAVSTGLAVLTGEPATLWPLYRDRWGRTVGHVEIAGRDLANGLLSLGWAQPWPHDDTGRALVPRPVWCLTAPQPTPRPE